MERTIAILGAGPAGLALAVRLLRRPDLQAKVVVIEQSSQVGGLAASFEHQGLHFDYGSHRLHPATPPEILADIQELLGPALLKRPRNGRIHLLGRFLKFPLKPLNLAGNLPPDFLLRFARDAAAKCFGGSRPGASSFAEVLLGGLGPTMCNAFYFPYARKLWGLDPEKISAEQAQRRISANSPGRLLRKAFGQLPGLKGKATGHFFYPVQGFGQIPEALAAETRRRGGEIRLQTVIEEVRLNRGRPTTLAMRSAGAATDQTAGPAASATEELDVDFVFSTIPVTSLAGVLRPPLPPEVREASEALRYRGMVLHYTVLRTPQFTPYDAHYFPEPTVLFSRLSEPKNYAAASQPDGLTGLCAEIPCDIGDAIWTASDDEITRRVHADLSRVGLPVQCPVETTFVRRIHHAYPVYDLEFAARLRAVNGYLAQFSTLVSLGRQGMFAHDNTHHTIEMAYRASECLDAGGTWDHSRWQAHQERWAKNVVED